jgi:membrane-bound lytic murein transglycosylase MltF
MPVPLHLKGIILAASAKFNICPYTIAALAKVESNYNVQAVGGIGERGLLQLRPEFFGQAGDLLDPKVNVFTATRHLAKLRKHCPHQEFQSFVVCYNLGVRKAYTIREPLKQRYFIKFRRELAQLKEEGAFD